MKVNRRKLLAGVAAGGVVVAAHETGGAVAVAAPVRKGPPVPKRRAGTRLLYVSPQGKDTNDGTLERPFATIGRARDVIREGQLAKASDVEVVVRGGTYSVKEPIRFGPADGGVGDFRVTYAAYRGETPVLSGGIPITNMKNDVNAGFIVYNVFRAMIPAGTTSRDLYVAGRRAERIRSNFFMPNHPPLPTSITQTETGYIIDDASPQNWPNPDQVEFVYTGAANGKSAFLDSRCPVKSVTADGTKSIITMQPEAWNKLVVTRTLKSLLPTAVENAFVFLNAAQHPYINSWYLNTVTGELYHSPRNGVDPASDPVVLGDAEQLVVVQGTATEPVRNLGFRGITFAHTTWRYPSTPDGYVDRYAGAFAKGPVPGAWPFAATFDFADAAVDISYAQGISLSGNTFANLGGSGVIMHTGVVDSEVTYSKFFDIGGNAITIDKGNVANPPEADAVRRITVADNTIDHAAATLRSSVGIFVGYISDSSILHNEICNLPYSGMSFGTGWNLPRGILANNKIIGNHVHHTMQFGSEYATLYMHDGGPLYFNGDTHADQRSTIQGNWMHDNGRSTGGLYFDSKASNYDITQNVLERSEARWWACFESLKGFESTGNKLEGNWTDAIGSRLRNETPANNTIGVNTTGIRGTWPAAAQKVMKAAGPRG